MTTAGSDGRPSTGLKIATGLLALLVGIGGGVYFSGALDDDGAEQVEGEIFLSPAASVGPDPFSATPLADPPDPVLAQPVTSSVTVPPLDDAPALTSNAGGEVGLYGGTLDGASCDPQQIVDFLAANPDKSAAWVAALDADPSVAFADGRRLTVSTVPEYMATLTPLVLRSDIRVTNHGFKNGKQTVLQSVLQKGTAVLVDPLGVPRVKCYCGNPLLPPVASGKTPKYTGDKWADFEPAAVTVIVENPTIITIFVVTDLGTGTLFDRPIGTKGANDTPNATSSTTAPTTVPGGSTTASTTTASTAPSSTDSTTSTTTSTTAPTTTTAPASAAALSAPSIAREPSVDQSCPAPFEGYQISGSYSVTPGAGLRAIFHEATDVTGDMVITTTGGDDGTYTWIVCGEPGYTYSMTLEDSGGAVSAPVTVTVS